MVGSSMSAAEQQRLAVLHEYGLLDTPAGDELEAVVRVAAEVADVPTATLNLIDEHRQCQLTTFGFDGADSPREESMCAAHFQAGRFVHLPDAREHPAYAINPWVSGQRAQLRFYAAAPLITPDGHALGTLCVFDDQAHVLLPGQIARLEDLALIVLALFERRRQARRSAALAADAVRRQQFTDTVLETIDVAVAAVDTTGHLTLFNRAARDWHGLDADPSIDPHELSGRYALFHTDGLTFLPEHQVPLLTALRDGEVHDAEMIIKRRGAPPVHVSATGRRLTDSDGTPWGAVVAMNDVTTDRAQRHALRTAHKQLTEASRQLTDTVADLQRSNAELSDFAIAVSHDLASPLAVVHGYLSLIIDSNIGHLDDQTHQWLDSAGQAVQRMQELIDSLLAYASAGRTSYRRQPAELQHLIDQSLTDLRGQIDDSGATIEFPRALPVVYADPTMLRQLLQNLISNAVKYRHPQRGCLITITTTEDHNSWTICVTDNGIGIPEADRHRIFDMFTQVEPGARTGHGIGLSTCHRIVSRHGGHIHADATPGGGTTIRFTLPKPS